MIVTSLDTLDTAFDLCIVGAGPSGIACALAARERGLSVLVLEAGKEQPIPGDPDILAADLTDPRWHDPTDVTSASALGGTSHWWGGRSVPFEPSDFETWPIRFSDLAPWYGRAADSSAPRACMSAPRRARSPIWPTSTPPATKLGARDQHGQALARRLGRAGRPGCDAGRPRRGPAL
ncbi:MAG: NAD(P)-binding protein [Hyphomonadaceae bacterium]